MKRIITSLFLFSASIVFAQAPSLQWARTINGDKSSQDMPTRSFKDGLGNVYITGWNANADFFLVKFDNNGNQVYGTTYNGVDNQWDASYDVIVDNNGNAYVGAMVDNVWPAVIKFDAAGNKVWTHRVYSVNATAFTSLAFDNASNPTFIYAGGGYSYVDSIMVDKIAISNGASSWTKRLEPGATNKVKTDGNGNPYICGYSAANYATQGTDGYIAKLSASGNLVWKQTYNGLADTSEAINNFEILSTGGVVFAGSVYDSTNTIPWVKVRRLSPTGQIVWDASYHVPGYWNCSVGDMAANSIKTKFYVAFSALENTGSGKTHAMLSIFDVNGNVTANNSYLPGSNTSAVPVDIEVDGYSNAYLLGSLGSGANLTAAFLWKLDNAANQLCSQVYQTLSPSGFIQNVINLHIDNAGHPLGTFNAFDNQGATYNDAYLARFNYSCGVDWEVIYNGKANPPDYTNGLAIDNAGNLYVSGTVIDDYTIADAVLAKYDPYGNQLWQNIFDVGNMQDFTSPVVLDAQANAYMLAGNSFPASLVKYDSAGSQQWIAATTHNATMVGVNASGFVYAGGGTLSNNINGSDGSSRDFNMTVVNGAGTILGTNSPSNNPGFNTVAQSLTVDNSGNAYVGGYTSGFGAANTLIQKFNATGQSVGYNYSLSGLDSTANPWPQVNKLVFNTGDGFLYALCQGLPNGGTHGTQFIVQLNTASPTANAILAFNDTNTASYFPADMAISSANEIYTTGRKLKGNQNYFYVQKWSGSNLAWEKLFFDNTGGPGYIQTGNAVTVDNAGNVYATGYLISSVGWNKQYILTTKISASGNVLWQKSYDGPLSGTADDWGQYVVTNNNGRVYVAGISTTGSAGDITILKYCDMADPMLSSGGNVSICSNASYTVSAPSASAYQWSNGATSQSVTLNSPGDYFCTIYQSDGCNKITDTLHVNVVGAPSTPSICMVTVDDSSKHNVVLWDKTPYNNMGVIGFNIYREDLTNIYHLVGSVPFNNLSQFMDLDPAANPNANTKRYKLTAVDSCGNESQMSNYHNTIYIVSNGGGQFSWNQLYTIENSPNPVVQYVLLRDDYNTNNWHAVDSTAGTQFNINDVNFATFQPTANWRVVTKWNITCTPTARLGGGNSTQTTIIKSKSNISNNRQIGINEIANTFIGIMPNPVQNTVSITFPMADRTTVKLMNLVGETMLSLEPSNSNSVQLDLSKLPSGMYLLQVENASGKFVKRLVKE